MLHPSHFDDKLNTSNFIAEISIAHSIRKCYKELNILQEKTHHHPPNAGKLPKDHCKERTQIPRPS